MIIFAFYEYTYSVYGHKKNTWVTNPCRCKCQMVSRFGVDQSPGRYVFPSRRAQNRTYENHISLHIYLTCTSLHYLSPVNSPHNCRPRRRFHELRAGNLRCVRYLCSVGKPAPESSRVHCHSNFVTGIICCPKAARGLASGIRQHVGVHAVNVVLLQCLGTKAACVVYGGNSGGDGVCKSR